MPFRFLRLFVFSPGVISGRNNEKTPREKTKRRNNATRKDEKTDLLEIDVKLGIST